MRIRLPPLAHSIANPVAIRLSTTGHDVSFDEGEIQTGASGLRLQVGATALDVAALISATSGVALEVARRVCDGAPVLLPDYEHTVFRVAWTVDLADAVVLAAGTQPEGCYGVAGREVWTLESMAHAMGDLIGERVDIVRASTELTSQVSPVPDAPTVTFPALLPSFVPTPAKRWMRAVLDAASSMPSPDTRAKEIALARRLLRKKSQ